MELDPNFRLSSKRSTPEELANAASEVERSIGEIIAGKRKPGSINVNAVARLVQSARDSLEAPAKVDRLQVRVSALHDVALDLRAMVLGALTAAARAADEDPEGYEAMGIVRALLMGQDAATCGALAVPFRQWWQAPRHHPLQVGMLVLSTHGEADGGDDDEERETGPVAVGQIVSADNYEGQGWTYGVVFANHTAVNITAFELADLDAYAVAPAPFVSPEGV